MKSFFSRMNSKDFGTQKIVARIIIWIIVIPIILNLILRLNWFHNYVVGDSINWLSFWGSFGGAAFGGIITLIVLGKTLKQNKDSNEVTQDLQVDILNIQMKERWINESITLIKKTLNPIDAIKLRRYTQDKISSGNEGATFCEEQVAGLNNIKAELNLHYDKNEFNDKKNTFLKNFERQYTHCKQHLEFFEISITYTSTTELKNGDANDYLDMTKKYHIISGHDTSFLTQQNDHNQILTIIGVIMIKGFYNFQAIYESNKKEIEDSALALINDEREKLKITKSGKESLNKN